MSDDALEVATPEEAATEVAESDVIAAEEEAAEADALAAALEAKFVQGGELQPGELEQAESLSRWARLKAQRARNVAARAAEARRLRSARLLAAEVEAYSVEGTELARLLSATLAADDAFRAEVARHNDRLLDWKARAKALQVPETDGTRVGPNDEHGGIRLGRDGSTEALQAGGRIFSVIDGARLLDAFRTQISDRAAILAAVEHTGEAAA